MPTPSPLPPARRALLQPCLVAAWLGLVACSSSGSDTLGTSSGATSGDPGSLGSSGGSGTSGSSGNSGSSGGGTSGGAGGSSSSSGGSSSSSGGSSSSSGGSSSSSGGSTGAFLGAPAFSGCSPIANSVANAHQRQFGNQNPAGRDCLTCHTAGGAARNYPMAFGGTVYRDAAGTMPVGAGVEVRLRDSTGAAVSACTDAAGNFFEVPPMTASFARNMQVGVRNNGGARLMGGNITTGACNSNSCHSGGGGGTGRIYLP